MKNINKLFAITYPASLDDYRGKKWAERKKLFEKQRIERGFDDTELWNLDRTFATLMLPRLKAYKKLNHYEDITGLIEIFKDNDAHVAEVKKENKKYKDLDLIIEGLEFMCSDDYFCCSSEEYKKVEIALSLFVEYIPSLWT